MRDFIRKITTNTSNDKFIREFQQELIRDLGNLELSDSVLTKSDDIDLFMSMIDSSNEKNLSDIETFMTQYEGVIHDNYQRFIKANPNQESLIAEYLFE